MSDVKCRRLPELSLLFSNSNGLCNNGSFYDRKFFGMVPTDGAISFLPT